MVRFLWPVITWSLEINQHPFRFFAPSSSFFVLLLGQHKVDLQTAAGARRWWRQWQFWRRRRRRRRRRNWPFWDVRRTALVLKRRCCCGMSVVSVYQSCWCLLTLYPQKNYMITSLLMADYINFFTFFSFPQKQSLNPSSKLFQVQKDCN